MSRRQAHAYRGLPNAFLSICTAMKKVQLDPALEDATSGLSRLLCGPRTLEGRLWKVGGEPGQCVLPWFPLPTPQSLLLNNYHVHNGPPLLVPLLGSHHTGVSMVPTAADDENCLFFLRAVCRGTLTHADFPLHNCCIRPPAPGRIRKAIGFLDV